jgi:hypothetical protein
MSAAYGGVRADCLTQAKMQAKGMQRAPTGVWNSGQFARMSDRLAS